ncbi:hypothetical protein B7494_g712 [Chlorociboria aeruginascens]|nr:hypothetical protein B7494_g712 [Chlorociboria aeruginascens]
MASYLVTGSGQGLGYSFITYLAQTSSNIVIGLSRNKVATEEKLREDGITNVHILQADVGDLDSLKKAAEATVKITGGKLDILINNAAYVSLVSAFTTISQIALQRDIIDADFETSFKVNVLGIINVFSTFLPLVLKSDIKKVVNISTGAADLDVINGAGLANQVPYAASKAAANVVVAVYNAEYKKDGVLFLSISPGFIQTERNAAAAAANQEGVAEMVGKFAAYAPQFKRPLTGEESASAVVDTRVGKQNSSSTKYMARNLTIDAYSEGRILKLVKSQQFNASIINSTNNPPSKLQTIVAERGSNTPPRNIMASSMNLPNDRSDDEWEYEYSTTETETYYVTLDLTTPKISVQRRKRPQPLEPEKIRWIDGGMNRNRRQGRVPKTLPTEGSDSGNKSPVEDDDDVEDDSDSPEPIPQNVPAHSASAIHGSGSRPGEVQILDLHTDHPVVSYNGHIYSCQWAENLGTELLFTYHDLKKTLPIMRSLPGNVDLIAASSARIISTIASMDARVDTRRASVTDRHNAPSIIPVGPAASLKRKTQAGFLERLMAIKEAKGEKDEVTVLAYNRKTNGAWKLRMKQKRTQERAKLQREIRASRSEVLREKIRARLAEMDMEDQKMAEEEINASGVGLKKRKPGKGKINNRNGSANKAARRPRGGMKAIAEKLDLSGSVEESVDRIQENVGRSVSTPTPLRWGDMEEDEGEPEDPFGDDFDDQEMYDEDAPGEIDELY